MKIDFSTQLMQLDGKAPILTRVNGVDDPVPLTLALASVGALTRTLDPKDDGKIKYECFKLALRIDSAGEQDLKPEEIVLLKQRIGLAWEPTIVGRCYDILNG